jgi:hypothetical protein
MIPLNLGSSWAKLIRARAHRHALNALEPALAPGGESNLPSIGIKFDSDTGDHVVYISRCSEYGNLFLRASLIFGDVVQDLRGALDHLVYALADWRTQGNIQRPDKTQFPICDGLGDFNSKANRYLSELHPLHVAVIERFQTYNPINDLWPTNQQGGHPLALLRDLSDADKHRLCMW